MIKKFLRYSIGWKQYIIILIGFILLGVLLAILNFQRSSKNSADFDEKIYIIDNNLDSRSYNQAKIILQDVLSTVSNKHFSMVLKRVYKYSSATDDWKFLYNAILERRNPGRATRLVQQIYVYSLLKTGDFNSVISFIADNFNRKEIPENFQVLLAEAILSAERFDYFEESGVLFYKELADLVSTAEPKPFYKRDADDLERLGKEFSHDLIFDSALIRLYQGEFELAKDLFKEYLTSENYDLPAYLSYYDAEYYELAKFRIDRYVEKKPSDVTRIIMQADLSFQRGDNMAGIFYSTQIVQLLPKFSWIPYVNLSNELLRTGQIEDAYNNIYEALKLFPDNNTVAITLATIYVANDQQTDADSIIKRLQQQDGEDLSVEIPLLEFDRNTLSPQGYSRRLWKLFTNNPENNTLVRNLTARLMSFGDLDGARLVLSQYDSTFKYKGHRPFWYKELQGILAALNGDLDISSERLVETVITDNTKASTWSGIYNFALVELKRNQLGSAKEWFLEAERRLKLSEQKILVENLPENEAPYLVGQNNQRISVEKNYFSQANSLIKMRLAEVYLAENDLDMSRHLLNEAIKLDLANLRARLIHEKLASDGMN